MSYRQRRSYGLDQEDRLPHGMVRIGYDADIQVYTYRDADGSIWRGPRGCQYGVLTKVRGRPRPVPSTTVREWPRSASLPANKSNAVFDDFLPKYSRDCEPGHRTLLSRMFSRTRTIVPPPVPPKDVPEPPKDVPEPPKDVPELSYLRLGRTAIVPPQVPPKDAPELSRLRPSARNVIPPIPGDQKPMSDDNPEKDKSREGPPAKGVANYPSRRPVTWRAEANKLLNSLSV